MGNIIVVDFRDNEDFENHPSMAYLKQTLNMISFLEEVPELWKLNDFFIDSVAEYLRIKRRQVEFVKLWDVSIDFSKNVGLITQEKFYPIIRS
jgi:hypothetical protein